MDMKGMKDIRLKEYDYKSSGYYFVTICANYQRSILTGHVKNVVAQFIERFPTTVSGVSVDYYVVMPSHLHIILVLHECTLKLGEVVRRLKAATSRKTGIQLWQPNYYEHVIRNEEALRRIREYIVNNPAADIIEFKQFYE
jgi:REP element-mobilizing transposase RayT